MNIESNDTLSAIAESVNSNVGNDAAFDTPQELEVNEVDVAEGTKDGTATQAEIPIEVPTTTTRSVDTNQPTQQPQSQVQTQPNTRSDGATVDKKGNLTLADGSFVSAGPARRFYEERQAANEVISKLQADQQKLGQILQHASNNVIPQYENQITQLKSTVDKYEQAAKLFLDCGLSQQEAIEAHQIAAAYKKNPRQAIEMLLASAKANGHNVDDLAPGVDTLAIKKVLGDTLAPFNEARQRQEQHEAEHTRARREADNFYGKYPDARLHGNEIAFLVDREKVSPEVAYYKLQAAAAREGFDWQKPLKEQAAAKFAQSQQTQVPPQSVTQRPLPNGRGANLPVTQTNNVPVNVQASENASYADIIREAMAAAGLDPNRR